MKTGPTVTRMVMFKHGVAYLERGGPAEGSFELSFKRDEMNDVLKSLAVWVARGEARVGAVAFEAPEDPEAALSERKLALAPGAALEGLLAAVRGRLKRELREAGRSCILIGPGRWGSRDPWLGIPVTWPQISTARAIVETDFGDLEVEPSQGSHFFHNLTSSGVAFLAVHRQQDGGAINWEWLDAQPIVTQELGGAVRHIRLERPVRVLVDGASNRGVVVQA